MKRVYRVTVTMEKTFERKATGEAKAMRDAIIRSLRGTGYALSGWSVGPTKITNRAIPDRKPTFADVERLGFERQRAADLARLQEIADRIAAPFPHLTKPRLQWAGNHYCQSSLGRNTAHAHIGRGKYGRGVYRMKNGRSRPIPKGLICLSPVVASYDADRAAGLLAHEIAHLKSQRGNGASRQHEAERELYETFKYGRVIEPVLPDWLFRLAPGPEYRCQYPGCEEGYRESFFTGTNPDGSMKPFLRSCEDYLHRRWARAMGYRAHGYDVLTTRNFILYRRAKGPR